LPLVMAEALNRVDGESQPNESEANHAVQWERLTVHQHADQEL
jgi:hypothetical protein